MKKHRTTALGLTAGLLGGGAAGLMIGVPALTNAADDPAVVQQDDGTTPDSTVPSDDTTDDTTADTTPDATDEATPDATDDATQELDREARIREALQELVDAGTITAEQADAVASHLADELPVRERYGPFGRHHHGRGFDGEVVAGLLGITTEQLRDALRDGSSIADIAAENGVDVQVVIDALVAEVQDHLDVAVADGRLTQAEADEKLAEATERITDMVNRSRPADATPDATTDDTTPDTTD
jgi:hypothetical protein